MFSHLSDIAPILLEEWDYDKNSPLLPDDVSAGSDRKIWWKCKKGHQWQARMANRALKHRGCPYCSNQRLLVGYNDLKTTNPKLVDEWCWEKNTYISPENVFSGSSTKVWWKCNLGHIWEASISSRSRGSGCPYCAGKAVLPGFNDLETTNPELSSEWNYEKNHGLTNKNGIDISMPSAVTNNSNQKVWWRCSLGHEFESIIANRTNKGVGCPYCSNRLVLVGFNDIATTSPELIREWNYEKNGDVLPTNITLKSVRKIWWRCEYGHEWLTSPYVRYLGCGCPTCSATSTSKPEQGISFYLSQACEVEQRVKFDGKEVDVFLPDYNIGIEYDGLYYHKNKIRKDNEKTKLLKDRLHCLIRIRESEENSISNSDDIINYKIDNMGDNYNWSLYRLCEKLYKITNNSKFVEIDIDAKRDSLLIRERLGLYKKANSLATRVPDIAAEWNYEKNKNLTPEMFMYGSSEKVWWKCNKNHEWLASISHRTLRKHGCPYCSGRVAVPGENDLETLEPDILKEWDYEKNNSVKPSNIKAHSSRNVWWKCIKGHSYMAPVYRRIEQQTGCPYCANKKILPGYNDLKTLNPNLAAEWDYDLNKGLTPSEVGQNSNRKVWWKCRSGHNWMAQICGRTSGNGCPFCAGHNVLKGVNDLLTLNPNVASEWDYERNSPLRPEDFFEKSEKKVWWIGKCGHSWKTAICIRTQGGNCPFCSGRMVLKGFNDLETLKPELSKEWDYQKNKGITPDNISIGSHKKVWWNCSKGHSWNADIHSRVKGNGCPICAGYRPVVCVETGEIFSGPAEVQAKKGICGSNIALVCKGIRKKAGGYHWRYTDL